MSKPWQAQGASEAVQGSQEEQVWGWEMGQDGRHRILRSRLSRGRDRSTIEFASPLSMPGVDGVQPEKRKMRHVIVTWWDMLNLAGAVTRIAN